MGISQRQWKVFEKSMLKGHTPSISRGHALISEDDYYAAHEEGDETLTRILAMIRFYIAEKAMDVVHALATGSEGKKRSGAAVKVLEAYMPALFRQKMAHKIQIDAKHEIISPVYQNPNLFLPPSPGVDIVDAEVVAIQDGKLPRKPGANPNSGVLTLAEKHSVGGKAGTPEPWSPQAMEEDDEDSATMIAEEA